MQAEHILIRPILPADDARMAWIIRSNLEQFHLDIPGTAYFDPELDHLSRYYRAAPDRRAYFAGCWAAWGLRSFPAFPTVRSCKSSIWRRRSRGGGWVAA